MRDSEDGDAEGLAGLVDGILHFYYTPRQCKKKASKYLPPPLVVDKANASSTGGGQKSLKCVIDKWGGVNDKAWNLMQNVRT